MVGAEGEDEGIPQFKLVVCWGGETRIFPFILAGYLHRQNFLRGLHCGDEVGEPLGLIVYK